MLIGDFTTGLCVGYGTQVTVKAFWSLLSYATRSSELLLEPFLKSVHVYLLLGRSGFYLFFGVYYTSNAPFIR